MSALPFILAFGCQTPEETIETELHTAEVRGANISGANISGQNISGQNISGQNISGQNISGQNISGANISGQNISGANISGQNISGANISGQNISGQNISGQNISGQNISGQNISGQNISGQNISGQNISGQNISGQNISGQNISGQNISGANVGGHNLGGQNVGGHNLGGHNLLHGDDLLPKGDGCVVKGVGTTEFAALLGQQSPDSTIYTQIGKLPWGYSSRTNGPIHLSAWEAIVRGDKTRCSFVLAAPPETTWSGVAGFMKAIFRWNAPQTQSMEIRGIRASARHDSSYSDVVVTYTGMMDAGALWRSGQISEKSLVAGELAFVAATTNNRSVMVDFASWVTDVGGAGRVLGQVENVNPPRFAESVYYAYEADDGSIGLAVGPASLTSEHGAYSAGLPSSYESLNAAYRLYQEGLFPKPIPTRCGGVLFLNARFGEPMVQGKCDGDVAWTVGSVSGQRTWETLAGSTAPMNQYMLLPADETTRLRRDGKIVLSETYIHMWDVNYELAPAPLPQDERRFLPRIEEQQPVAPLSVQR